MFNTTGIPVHNPFLLKKNFYHFLGLNLLKDNFTLYSMFVILKEFMLKNFKRRKK